MQSYIANCSSSIGLEVTEAMSNQLELFQQTCDSKSKLIKFEKHAFMLVSSVVRPRYFQGKWHVT